jgi:tetratricopeptide (TPR) repeat protein
VKRGAPERAPEPPRRPHLTAFALATLVLVGVAAVAWWRLRAPSAPNAASAGSVAIATASFEGSAACAACHPNETALWRGSQHRAAMQPATAETMLGAFDGATFEHGGTTSRFARDGDRFVVNTDGAAGTPADFAVDYTFGVFPLQQYLIAAPGGRWQALSVAWDARPHTAGGQRWFHLYPGERIDAHDPLHWTRPAQNWNHGCADCHATGLRKRYDATRDRFDTQWAELGVGCEGCHGPGSAHVAWASVAPREGANPHLAAQLDERRGVAWHIDAATGNAVRSAPRESEREIEVCAQCHARRSSLSESYAAGEPFLDHYRPALLEPQLYFADGQQRDEVYSWGSFLQSRMYAKGVTCSDCHEPHAGKLRAEGGALCATCHAPDTYAAASHHHHAAGSPGSECVACHMPATTYMVVDPRHDHSLRVPRPDLTLALGTPNACAACHAERAPSWAAQRVRAWLGRDARGSQRYAEALHAADSDALASGALLRAVANDAAQPAIARASALTRLDAESSRASRAALASAARDPNALVRLGALQGLESAPVAERAAAAGASLVDPRRAVRLEAVRVLASASQELSPGQRADFERAANEYVAALRLDADRAEARAQLGAFLAQRGDGDAARAELHAALAIEPAFAPAYVNLADLERAAGREPEALRVLETGIAAVPTSAALHHAYGLALVRSERREDALAELARAVALDPSSARFAYVHAVALHAAGRAGDAITLLERTSAAHPRDPALLEALASFHAERGDAEAAARAIAQLDALSVADP